MKDLFSLILLLAVSVQGLVLEASAASPNELHLVEPKVPPIAVAAISDGKGALACDSGLELQKNGFCCPPGTSNTLWSTACTPPGIIDGQIFSENNTTQYCPSPDMFIVSDKNNHWFSCAASDSTVLYPLQDKPDAYKFCLSHGYGYLMKIRPRSDAGCIKYGVSQGDGCIEAGTCSF